MMCCPDDIVERQIEEGMISPELREKISFVLLRKHRHQTKKPIHRSLADIGKSSSSTSECPHVGNHQLALWRVNDITGPVLLTYSSHSVSWMSLTELVTCIRVN